MEVLSVETLKGRLEFKNVHCDGQDVNTRKVQKCALLKFNTECQTHLLRHKIDYTRLIENSDGYSSGQLGFIFVEIKFCK